MKQQRTSRKDDNRSPRTSSNSKPSRAPRTSRSGPSRSSDDRPKRPYTKSTGNDRPYSPKPRQDSASSDRPRRDGDSKPFRKPYGDRPAAPRRDSDRPYTPRPRRDDNASSDRPRRDSGDTRVFKKSYGNKPSIPRREDDRPYTPRPRRDEGSTNDRPSYPRKDSDSKPFRKPYSDRPAAPRREDGDRPFSIKKRKDSDRPVAPRRDSDKSYPPRPRRDADSSKDNSLQKRLYTNPERPERQQSESNFDEFLNDKRKTNKKTILTLSSAKQDVAFERIKKRAAPILQFGDKGLIRLNKFIAQAGICSRREADNLISSGMIKVNGEVITEMGTKIAPTDLIEYKGQRLQGEKMVYILMNKPKDYITTADDPEGRKTVLDLIGSACQERIYPVGRLDRNTTGVLLLTNDGRVAQTLMHPSNNVKKLYQVDLDRPLTQEDYITIKTGVTLEDGFIKPDAVEYGNELHQIGIEIHSGRNRIVRRIFESLGYTVARLDRIAIGSLNKKTLPRGHWRFLSEKEIGFLKMMKV